MNKTVSIITYCKDKEGGIHDTLWSILEQNYHNKNIVVVDDASEDKTWLNICESLKRTDKVREFEFKQTIQNTCCIAVQNEFTVNPYEIFRTSLSHFWSQSDYFGLVCTPAKLSAGKINSLMKWADENISYIYGDYVTKRGGLPLTVHQTSFKDKGGLGFFNKNFLEKVDLTKLKSIDELYQIARSNTLTYHLPEILDYA